MGRPSLGDPRLDAQPENAEKGTLEQPRGKRWGRKCPHCKGPSKIRSSWQQTSVVSEVMRVCGNPMCGFVWIDQLHAIRSLSMSSTPDPSIYIRPSTHIRRKGIDAAFDPPGIQNHLPFGDQQ